MPWFLLPASSRGQRLGHEADVSRRGRDPAATLIQGRPPDLQGGPGAGEATRIPQTLGCADALLPTCNGNPLPSPLFAHTSGS